MSAIEDNVDIKRALYPVSRSNPPTARGGGRAKIEHHVELARQLFAEHDVYGGPFSLAQTAGGKELTAWGTKIKNRIMA